MTSHGGDHNKSYNNLDPVTKYVLEHSLRQTEVQKELLQRTLQHERSVMMGSPEELQLLANMLRMIRAKKVLDVGVFTGCSSLSAALALPPDGIVHALDVENTYVDIGRPFWKKAGVENKIKVHIAPALETLDKFIAEGQLGTFDFAFIDADKANYINYYERCLQLLRSGGIIAVDNTLWNLKVVDLSDQSESTKAIRAFNDHVKDDQRVDISFLNIADGVTLLFKK